MWKINLNLIKNMENKPKSDQKYGKQTLIRSKMWKINLIRSKMWKINLIRSKIYKISSTRSKM